MLQYRDFKFASKEDFKNYIEKRIVNYWRTHTDSFLKICEDLDSCGFLGDDRCYQMDDNNFYSEVFEKLIDDYTKIFTDYYGCLYYNLFGDVYDIIRYSEDEIQSRMNDDYYEHLFEDDEDFFLLSDDDLNDEYKEYKN